jgi:hypothetical protein
MARSGKSRRTALRFALYIETMGFVPLPFAHCDYGTYAIALQRQYQMLMLDINPKVVILLGDPLRSKQELRKRISSLILTPTVHDGSPAYAVSGSVMLFSSQEAVMLPRTRDCTSKHHSFDISLDGIVLKLDSRSSVIAVVNHSSTIDKREGLAEAA